MITKKAITKIDVNQAADRIAFRGEVPTIAAVRAELQGRGSETTIHNYLKAWKKAKLLAKQELKLVNNNQELLFIEEKRELEQVLNQQITQNEHYAQELINAEKTNVVLKEEISQHQAAIQELKLELAKMTVVNNTLEKVTEKIQQQLALNETATISKQKLLIAELQQEIKNLNANSMAAIQELSSKGHETLMQEKVNAINLQAKIENLTKELTESKKQLELANVKAHVQNQTLQRQINWQQQILKKYLLPEELQALNQGVELVDLESSYGK